jgi:hypothetical protein
MSNPGIVEENHAIEACARLIAGSDDPTTVEWVTRKLRRGDFPGYRVRRQWRMTDADIAAAIESLRPTATLASRPSLVEAARIGDRPLVSSMTRTSQRRLAR